METKYRSAFRFWMTRAYRGLIRVLLRPLVRWRPGALDEDGLTLVVGCHSELLDMLAGNLACLARQRLTNVREILLVFDAANGRHLLDTQASITERFPGLPCRIIVYSPLQRFVTRLIRWAWVNSWLSWCIGIAQSRTRWVMLHDFDAMLVDPEFVENRLRAIRQSDFQYLGITNYEGNGIVRADGLAATIEMVIDAQFVQRTFPPIAIFNHVATFRGRRVDFDTFLYAQSRAGRSASIPVELDDVVHPSQMICQYAYLRQRDRRLPLDRNNLMLLPYFTAVGGDLRLMSELTAQMEGADGAGRIVLYERSLDLGPLEPEHLEWIVKQARHLDQAMFGEVRPEVRRYLEALARFVLQAKVTRPRTAVER